MAILSPWEKYHFNCMPSGLKNALATFQRLMNTVLEGQDDHASAYIDDVVVYSNTWDEQLGYIEEVLAVLRRFGLTAKSVKCQWSAKSLIYLGHEVGRGKVSVLAVKVKAIKKYK